MARQSLLLGGALSLLLVAVCLPAVPADPLHLRRHAGGGGQRHRLPAGDRAHPAPAGPGPAGQRDAARGGGHPHPHVGHGRGEPGQHRRRLPPHLRRRSSPGPGPGGRRAGAGGGARAGDVLLLPGPGHPPGRAPGRGHGSPGALAPRSGRPAPPAGDRGPGGPGERLDPGGDARLLGHGDPAGDGRLRRPAGGLQRRQPLHAPRPGLRRGRHHPGGPAPGGVRRAGRRPRRLAQHRGGGGLDVAGRVWASSSSPSPSCASTPPTRR